MAGPYPTQPSPLGPLCWDTGSAQVQSDVRDLPRSLGSLCPALALRPTWEGKVRREFASPGVSANLWHLL